MFCKRCSAASPRLAATAASRTAARTVASALTRAARASISRNCASGSPATTTLPSRTSTRSTVPLTDGRTVAHDVGRNTGVSATTRSGQRTNVKSARSSTPATPTTVRRRRGIAKNAARLALIAPRASANGTWLYNLALRIATVAWLARIRASSRSRTFANSAVFASSRRMPTMPSSSRSGRYRPLCISTLASSASKNWRKMRSVSDPGASRSER